MPLDTEDLACPLHTGPVQLRHLEPEFMQVAHQYGLPYRAPKFCMWHRVRDGHWALSFDGMPIHEIIDDRYFYMFEGPLSAATMRRMMDTFSSKATGSTPTMKFRQHTMPTRSVDLTTVVNEVTNVIKRTTRVEMRYTPHTGVMTFRDASPQVVECVDGDKLKLVYSQLLDVKQLLLAQAKMKAFDSLEFTSRQTLYNAVIKPPAYLSTKDIKSRLDTLIDEFIRTKDGSLTKGIMHHILYLRQNGWSSRPLKTCIESAFTDIRKRFKYRYCVTIGTSDNQLKVSDANQNQDGLVLPDAGLREVPVSS